MIAVAIMVPVPVVVVAAAAVVRSIAAPVAPRTLEASVDVLNLAVAAVIVAELGRLPSSACVLALGGERGSTNVDVPAGLLVRAARLRNGGGCSSENQGQYCHC
jgi:hypothetical protein